ncbi:MAG: ATP-binding cassette domain-containing protein, partial [Synergistaceae bacterium]|nr:ATP-binding cassette domain-containing protein [Synergistaceae bacterium]
GTLSGGEQQMLAIGRALMARPKILLLDEPSLGLAPIIIQNIFKELKRINEQGVSILLVEQNAKQALLLSHRAYVLQTGRLLKEGLSRDLLEDSDIKAAYLGQSS